nr:testis-expressed protein 48 [Vulpes vulpes]
MGSYARFGNREVYYPLGKVDPVQPIMENFQWASRGQVPETMAPIPLPLTAAHQNLASKIFSLCCRDCEEPHSMDDSKVPSQTQEPQPLTCSRYQTRTPRLASLDLMVFVPLLLRYPQISFSCLQKEELASKNPKCANEASRLPLGQPLMGPEKRASSTSNNKHEAFFLEGNTHVSPRDFYKRNPTRYSQDLWPFQPCHTGRP